MDHGESTPRITSALLDESFFTTTPLDKRGVLLFSAELWKSSKDFETKIVSSQEGGAVGKW
jgi:hypothetical protein